MAIEATLSDDRYNAVTVNTSPGTKEIYLVDVKDKESVVLSEAQKIQLFEWLKDNITNAD